MASAPIGEIPVLITGDWSDLQSSLDDAVKAAETGAEDIAAAFNVTGDTGISDSVEQATSALETFGATVEAVDPSVASLAEGITNVGETAAGAAPGLAEVSQGLTDVSESGHEAEGGIAGTVEKLIELGEALVIADAMKDFAEDALEVYGNVQKASISLTALTGSAEESEAMLEKLKAIATSDALSFEPLVGAAQKMTALGFSTEQTYKALQVAADTAAATGAGFDRVTQAIERMALSGAAGARQLATLGISANTLGNIMGVTATEVTGAFKALDQTQRLEVLEQALSKFGGVAGQVAQGILGQWQNFKTQFEFVMESVGAALAPVAADFLAFVTSDILPFIKSMVDAFNELPGPVKDFAVVIGLAAAAIPVLNVGLGALLKLLETFEVLNLAEWGTALVASSGNVVYAIQNGLVGALTTGETLLLRLGQAAGVAAAAFAGWELGTWLYNNIPAMKAFGDAMSGWIQQIPGIQSLINQFSGLTDANTSLAKATADLNQKLALTDNELFQGASESMTQFAARVREAAAALMSTQQAIAQITPEMLALANAEGLAAQGFANQQKALTDAKAALQAVTIMYQDGAASLGQYRAAQAAVEAAQTALNPDFVTGKMATTELATATKDLSASQATLGSLLRTETAPGLESVTAAQNNLKSAQTSYESSLATFQQAQINLNNAVAMGTAGYKLQQPAIDALKVAETNAKAAKDDLTSAEKSLTQAQQSATAVSKEQATTDSDYATMLNTLGKAALQGYATDQAAVTAAAGKYHDAVVLEMDIQAQLDALVQEGKQGSDDYKTAQLALSSAHQQVTSDLKTLNATTQDYNTTSKDLLTAQKAIQSSESQLQQLYISQSIPDVHNLTEMLQNLRDAKTQVAADTQAQTDAENALQDVITDMLQGTASIGDVTAATLELDQQRTQTTADTKDLTQTETQLTSTFGITKQVMLDVTNVQNNMSISTQNANAAFSALGIQSADALQKLADKATTAYNTISQSGTASANQVRDAQIKSLQDQQAAYIAAGTNLSSDQQHTLTNLLNQQTDFNNSMIDHWHTLYTTIENDVQNLSNTLLTDLFTGSGSFGKDAIKGLEQIAAAFVSTLIQPVTAAIGKFIAGALTNLINGFSQVASTATQAGSQVSLAFFGQATSSGVSSAASGITGALGAVTSSLTGIVSAIGSVVGAVAGIIGDIQTVHTQNILSSIEKETARMAIYLGDQGGNSILGLMWRLVGDIEFGVMEKGILALSTTGLKTIQDMASGLTYFEKYALSNLGQINSNTGSMLQAIQKGVNVTGSGSGGLSTAALDNINNTLQYDVGLNPWWQTAIENMNNGIVACAGWLQGIVGLLQSGISTAGSTTSASSAGLSALATYIGANFTSLETWLFNALGKTMALPALPGAIALPVSLGGALPPDHGGGLTINMTNTVNGSVVGQNGLNQFANGIGNIIVNRLRGAGMKY